MTLLSDPLLYLFYPNPGNASWTSPKAFVLLVLCLLFITVSFGLKRWRGKQGNAVLRRLSRSWSSSAFWFGITGLVLLFARIESIGYVAMRIWWAVWLFFLLFYLFVQVRVFRARYYEVLPREVQDDDPRAKYLPRSRKRKR
ncbi:MAG: hypothetical protein WCX29_00485 [Candidatus Peribacteraceae bacterium]|jgi:hypothetical protein|nr:hypothetical protein [Candidatus Peribacteria bacterium]